jgi:surface antigen
VTIIGARRRYSSGIVGREGRGLSAGGLALAVLVALANGACSLAVPMTPLGAVETTQSVAPRTVSPLSAELGEEDWRRAKGALAVALDPQGSGAKVSWDNPDTTLRGTFTPVGQPFVKSDEICRAFLATVNGQATESVLQGTACRPSGGEWTVKDVRPFKRA